MLMHCITFAFSQCFMHFRCVFYLLKSCVLVGLDWAEPMMFILLHITCSCIFHAYVPFFSFLCTIADWYFFASLSFSLSDSLRMATKRKTTPSRNPLRSRASSSSDSTPFHVRFRDDKAHQDFLENFSKHGIHSECHIILSNFFDTNLPTVIHKRGWESLCEIPMSCPTVIIQEFYSNMHSFDSSVPRFITSVKGTRIVVTGAYL